MLIMGHERQQDPLCSGPVLGQYHALEGPATTRWQSCRQHFSKVKIAVSAILPQDSTPGQCSQGT